MNSKIEDIALDCIVVHIGQDHWIFTPKEFENFVQKTSHECIEYVNKLRGFSGTLNSGEIVCSETWILAIQSVIQELKEFFGKQHENAS